MTDQTITSEQQPACPWCGHAAHHPGTECESGVEHGPKRWHRCLCLNLVGADYACHPQMTCQGGTLGYSDVWYLQRRDGAARQATGQADTKPDPTIADDPTPLRWGLGDVLHGDDDTVIVCLFGPDREPYWLELDPERAAALRDDLSPPAVNPACTNCNDGATDTDDISLCGHCGVPREGHHHGYISTADAIAASPYSRTTEPAPVAGQPAATPDTDALAAETLTLAEAIGRNRFADFLDKHRAVVRAAVLREAADRFDAFDRPEGAALLRRLAAGKAR